MKKKYFNLRISERRLNKIRVYAATHDKTMTQVIEELIDGLPLESLGNWSTSDAERFIPRSSFGLRRGASRELS